MIGVIDYGAGNLKSVCNSLGAMNAKTKLVKSPEDLCEVTSIIFPGVGSFGDSAHHLEKQNLSKPLKNWIIEDRPFLGICIGFQMLFEASDESPAVVGLGVLPGKVVKFSKEQELKIPHMGWNNVEPTGKHYYFVHSYYVDGTDPADVLWTADYGSIRFPAAIRHQNIYGCQFHPEKSQTDGLRFLRAFLLGSGQ